MFWKSSEVVHKISLEKGENFDITLSFAFYENSSIVFGTSKTRSPHKASNIFYVRLLSRILSKCRNIFIAYFLKAMAIQWNLYNMSLKKVNYLNGGFFVLYTFPCIDIVTWELKFWIIHFTTETSLCISAKLMVHPVHQQHLRSNIKFLYKQ